MDCPNYLEEHMQQRSEHSKQGKIQHFYTEIMFSNRWNPVNPHHKHKFNVNNISSYLPFSKKSRLPDTANEIEHNEAEECNIDY